MSLVNATSAPSAPTPAVPSRELELLVRCARPTVTDRDTARVRTLLEEDPSWGQLVETGVGHGVVPLLYRRLQLAPDCVPSSVLETLRTRSRAVEVRSLQYVRELHRIVEAFEAEGVRSIPFKGPVLAAYAYGDLSLREFGDLDVLVHERDLTAAVDLLEERGYGWICDAPRLDDAALLGGPFTMPLVSEYQLRRGDIEVEIRCRVGESDLPFGIDFETLWERRDTVSVGGVDLPALDPADRVLMLAYHGTKHRWHLLKWTSDVAAVIDRSPLEWEMLFSRSRNAGLERRLLVGIELSRSMFGVDVPDRVERRIRNDDRAEALADDVVDRLDSGVPTRPAPTKRIVYNAKAVDSPTELPRMLLRRQRLHPSLFEYGLHPLPGRLHPLYYPLVPLRLVGEQFMKIIGQ